MAAAKKNAKTIEIPPQKIELMTIYVGGAETDSPMVCVHRFSEKARKMILDVQQKKAKSAKEPRDPHAEYLASKYVDQKGDWEGLPAAAFRRAIIDAASFVDGVTKVQIRGAIFVRGDGFNQDGLSIVKLKYDREYMREDVVRLPNGSADLRYRAAYENWGVKLVLKVDPDILSPQQVHHLVQRAGFCIGVCEARPQKSGDWGQFEIISEAQYNAIGSGKKAKKAA